MSYKQRFQDSQGTAYYKNIATKIDRDMSKLRSQVETSPTAPRRWVWELIQNARDVHHNGGVRIQITFDSQTTPPRLTFRHSGKPFTAENIRYLIEQISTKEREKDEEGKRKSSGKFGTGFLTTHLLSEVVEVTGIAKEPDLEYKQFSFVLDRSSEDLNGIIEAVERSTESVENLDELPIFTNYQEGSLNTEFTYRLTKTTAVEVAKKGLKDMQRCLAYTLTFVPEINGVEILPNQEMFKNSSEVDPLGDLVEVVTISRSSQLENPSGKNFHFATISEGFTTIAIPITMEGEKISICQLDNELPRIFCDFPLVGAEVFPFPVVVNNPNFNPTEPRDGILLTGGEEPTKEVAENRKILQEAINLYFQLLEFAASQKWQNLHLLANLHSFNDTPSWITSEWYGANILKPIRTRLLKAKIVNTASGGDPVAILNDEGKKYVLFPTSGKKETRQKIWELANRWFPHQLPDENEVELWYKLSWHECGKLTVEQLAQFVESLETLEILGEKLSAANPIEWLIDFYDLVKLEEKEYDAIINNYAIFPNQNGEFFKKQQLKLDAGDIPSEFKEILKLLDYDIKSDLLDGGIRADFSSEETIDQLYVVKEIASAVSQKAANRETAKEYREAFSKLLIWFKEQPELAKTLFPDIYPRKHLLYDEEVIMDNMDKAEKLNDLLTDYGAENLNELKKLIERGKKNEPELLPVTQEILASMGITSPEEWTKALEDQDLAAMFDHTSLTTPDMFIRAHSLIESAKANIINHLETLSNYDLTHAEPTALTVIAGVRKDGREICIVARPAYKGEVIIYYDAEKDILDYEDSELWIDDGITPRPISLGHILKTAQIRKFPI